MVSSALVGCQSVSCPLPVRHRTWRKVAAKCRPCARGTHSACSRNTACASAQAIPNTQEDNVEAGHVAEDDSNVSPPAYRYKRVMLKISGEALEGQKGFGIDPDVLRSIAGEIATASRAGVEVAIVVGGGNFFRGVNRWTGLDHATADTVGMLATVMNGVCLQSALESEGVAVRMQTAIEMREVAEPYIRRRAIRHLERGRVVIFGAGTGNPFFTTDTAAALRAAEIGAQVYLKGTQVDGIYDSDPKKNSNARRYSHLSYRKCIVDDLKVLDETAFTLCKENQIPVRVFDLHVPGNVVLAIMGNTMGTVVDRFPDEAGDLADIVPGSDDATVVSD